MRYYWIESTIEIKTKAFKNRLCASKGAFKPSEQRARARTRAFFLDLRMLFSAFTPKYQRARMRTKS